MTALPPRNRFALPPPPAHETGAVKAWRQPVVIPTYLPHAADRNPMFLERRVYQGSSGRVYPLPFIDRIDTEARDHAWQAVHLENEFIRVMILPELGGRVHVGLDKTNQYDFFYRQNVIKPALVGLAGPWISGGVEFNWPQHHRPATFMPVESEVERHADASVTVWLSDHDPMSRMKGMHGVCLYPGRASIELKVRLYNRTPFVQTFLWWANVATHVHELYQSFFPPDVHYVADHAKRAMSAFPRCRGSYYGVDYAARARDGVPAAARPARFVPDGSYPPDDLSWYANIPVPTSYMAMGSTQNFCGGYDHRRRAGLVHFADHHISPGKKQWTWGNHEFGYAWDRNLTDGDGPYIELMAGVYTDNQPDFSFLAPGETKTFSQYWYPIQEIGPAQAANLDAALSLRVAGAEARLGVSVTRSFPNASVAVTRASGGAAEEIARWQADLAPGAPLLREFTLPDPAGAPALCVSVRSAGASPAGAADILAYQPPPPRADPAPVPPPATEPPPPWDIASNDELYITGLHLSQYRHATRQAEDYWAEALRRDPGDARSNNALGLHHLRGGEFAAAESCFRAAIARLTARNPNPYDGEPYYNLGLALRYRERDEAAYAAFYKSTWNFAWRAAGYLALAEIDASRCAWAAALEHLDLSLSHDSRQGRALSLRVIALRRLGRGAEAEGALGAALALDPLNAWCRDLDGRPPDSANQLLLDVAFDYARAGLYAEAGRVLRRASCTCVDGSVPIVLYALADFAARTGDAEAARQFRERAALASPDYCFPSRLEELVVLERAVAARPDDARALFYLGNLLYDRRRYPEAMEHWERSARLAPACATVWRNLGIASFNVLADPAAAALAFERACAADPHDARVFYERDQLWKRTGVSTAKRLAELAAHPRLVALRDDLSVELATLLNQEGRHEDAAALLAARNFQPWEGGEGLALGQYVRAQLGLGRQALLAGDPRRAQRHFDAAHAAPVNLGEAKHLLANQSNIDYWCGVAAKAAGDGAAAEAWWARAAAARGDFEGMSVRAVSQMTYYGAMALRRLGREPDARQRFAEILAAARALPGQPPAIDYFATSLPAMLLFHEDLGRRNRLEALFLEAQARFGLGDGPHARALLDEVLALDPAHGPAADLLAEIASETAAAERLTALT